RHRVPRRARGHARRALRRSAQDRRRRRRRSARGPVKLQARRETWPVAGVFRIARGAVTSVEVVVVEVEEDGLIGRGEGCPEARYQEGATGCLEQLESVRAHAASGLDRIELQDLLPAGAARNALDCALWDLEAKRRDAPAWRVAGLAGIEELVTAYTISLDRPETMGERAAASSPTRRGPSISSAR